MFEEIFPRKIRTSVFRNLKKKDLDSVRAYLPHLQQIQKVDRTFNFPYSTVTSALQKLDKDVFVNFQYIKARTSKLVKTYTHTSPYAGVGATWRTRVVGADSFEAVRRFQACCSGMLAVS